MRRAISPRERRLIALLILVALLAGAYLLGIAPILDGFAARAERREQLALRHAHNLRTIATIPRLRRQAERQRSAAADFAVEARTVEQGREWLKARLSRAIEAAGGVARGGTDAEGRPGWARARMTTALNPAQVAELLGRLEREPPWLVVEALTLTAGESPTGQPTAMDVEVEASIPLRTAAAR